MSLMFDRLIMVIVLAVILGTLPRLVAANPTCYRPNREADHNDIQPCHTGLPSGSQSACCNLGKSPPDLCLAGGLCYRQDGYDGNALIYAVGCTDVTGADLACQQYCPVRNGGAFMYALNACFDGRWCCNNLTLGESCCDPSTGAGVFTMNHLLSLDPTPTATAVNPQNSPTVTTTTMTSTITSIATETSCSTTREGNSTGVLIGASLGSALGGLLIAAVASALFIRRLRRQQQWQNPVPQIQSISYHPAVTSSITPGGRHEMSAKGMAHASGLESSPTYEVDGNGRAELR